MARREVVPRGNQSESSGFEQLQSIYTCRASVFMISECNATETVSDCELGSLRRGPAESNRVVVD